MDAGAEAMSTIGTYVAELLKLREKQSARMRRYSAGGDVDVCGAQYAIEEYDPAPREEGHVWPAEVLVCELEPGHEYDHEANGGRARWEQTPKQSPTTG
jgi:hypothetical protein